MNVALRLLMRKPASTGLPLTGQYQAAAYLNSNVTTYTYTSVAIGTASATRNVVVAVAHQISTTTATPTVTIGGITATLVTNSAGATFNMSVFRALVTTGTTATIVVTYAAAHLRGGISVWSVDGTILHENGSTNHTTGVSPSTSVTGYASGFVIAYVMSQGSTSFTWTNATERQDSVPAGTHSSADATTAGSTTITATAGIANNRALVAAAFGG